MANDLTGNFDVVAEFAIAAANRVLAAMHRSERFPHSLALHVDDNPPPNRDPRFDTYAVVEVLNTFGDTVVDHRRIVAANPLPGVQASTDPIITRLGPVVNSDVLVIETVPFVPSRLQGRAQLQVAPPTLEIAPGSSTSMSVRMAVRARYFPDPGTSPLAEFVHGEIRLTAPVSKVASQVASLFEIDIKANDVGVSFTPTFASAPLGPADVAGINQLIRNVLRTSLQPSSTTLPAALASMQIKSVAGSPNAIAVMLNMAGPAPSTPGDPATVHAVFLGGGDDFAFAAGNDFIQRIFSPIMSSILSQPLSPVHVDIPLLFFTFHATYTITLQSGVIELQSGRIALTLNGHAHTPTTFLPDFDFTVTQPFTLRANGSSADLVVGEHVEPDREPVQGSRAGRPEAGA